MAFVSVSFEVVVKQVRPWFTPHYTEYNVVRRVINRWSRGGEMVNVPSDTVVYTSRSLDNAIEMRLKYRTEEIV